MVPKYRKMFWFSTLIFLLLIQIEWSRAEVLSGIAGKKIVLIGFPANYAGSCVGNSRIGFIELSFHLGNFAREFSPLRPENIIPLVSAMKFNPIENIGPSESQQEFSEEFDEKSSDELYQMILDEGNFKRT